MRAIGFPTFRYKLVAFVIAGALCGLAGALLANHTNFISPAIMFWTRSGDLMVMVMLGGLGTPFGPVIGAVTYLLLEEALSRVTEYSGLFLGPALLLVAIYLRGGIEGLFRRKHAMTAPLLQVDGLTKRFGGVVAADSIALDLAPGEFHAVIGPNGAGKTTLVALLAGELRPMTAASASTAATSPRLPADRRSRLGLARSFQITSLFRGFHCARQRCARRAGPCRPLFRFWRAARRDAALARTGREARSPRWA